MEVGDKVVCINDNWGENILVLPKLYNIYTITDYYISGRIELDCGSYSFDTINFITELEFRRLKLLKLKERIDEKHKNGKSCPTT